MGGGGSVLLRVEPRCKPVTKCGKEQYQLLAPGPYNDRACLKYTLCDDKKDYVVVRRTASAHL